MVVLFDECLCLVPCRCKTKSWWNDRHLRQSSTRLWLEPTSISSRWTNHLHYQNDDSIWRDHWQHERGERNCCNHLALATGGFEAKRRRWSRVPPKAQSDELQLVHFSISFLTLPISPPWGRADREFGFSFWEVDTGLWCVIVVLLVGNIRRK